MRCVDFGIMIDDAYLERQFFRGLELIVSFWIAGGVSWIVLVFRWKRFLTLDEINGESVV